MVEKVRVRKPNSAINFTVHTMNGGPMPESIQRKLEDAVQAVVDDCTTRLLIHVVRT